MRHPRLPGATCYRQIGEHLEVLQVVPIRRIRLVEAVSMLVPSIGQTDIDSLYDRYQHAYGQKQGTP